MTQKCKPNYKNLNTIQSYSEQKYATVQWCQQNCENDEWLRQQVEQLRYLSPPAVRKKFIIGKEVDDKKSYGYAVGSNNKVQFSNRDKIQIPIDFSDISVIDESKTTTTTAPYTVTDDAGKDVPRVKIVLPNTVETHEIKPVYNSFGTAKSITGYNSAWYVGFDKTRNFYLQPGWINNWKDPNIPSVARCQTFKCEATGKLDSVDLRLEYNGSPSTGSSPLYVQIWTTYYGSTYKTTWNTKTKKIEYNYVNAPSGTTFQRYKKVTYQDKDKKGNLLWLDKKKKKPKMLVKFKKDKNGKYIRERQNVYKPNAKQSGIYHPLAEAVYNPQGTTKGGFPNIHFDNPPVVEKDKYYAIVLFSPLNNWENCPRWAGWGRNCKRDRVYPDGDAFYSVDNGRSWKRYGKIGKTQEDIKEYKQGKWVPQDFAFQCNVETKAGRTWTETVYSEGDYYLYLKPIYDNPIYEIGIHTIDGGTEGSDDNVEIQYQFSIDGRTWVDIDETLNKRLETPSKVVFVRARLSRADGDNYKLYTPYIEHITIDLYTTPAEEMYVRTTPYNPPITHILGASVWGRIFTPFEFEETVDCNVEIIETKEVSERFDIVELDMLDEKLAEKGLDGDWLVNKPTAEERCLYLTDNPDVLKTLKYHQIYIKPFEMNGAMYNLSFAPSDDELVVSPTDVVTAIDEGGGEVLVNVYPDKLSGFEFTDEVAHPVISCELEPENGEGHGASESYGEWYDYVFDYTNNQLVFHRKVLETITQGNLIVTYNPVFISGLSNNEVGVHYDEETGIRSDGLILDYFKEKINITSSNVESRRVLLKVQPVDPIRQVYLYKYNSDEGDEPIELFEDADYTVDIYSHELVFEVNNDDGISTILDVGDILQVVYTPNLDDDSICIGYHAKRGNKDKQCYIDDYYIEYKV